VNAKTPPPRLRGRSWTYPEQRRLIALRRGGWSFADIGRELDRSEVACSVRFRRLSPGAKAAVMDTTTWKQRLGGSLRAEREKHGMSRACLAGLTGLTVRSLRRLEQGECIGSHSLDRVLNVLSLDLVPTPSYPRETA